MAKVAVLQALAGLAGRLVLPLVELELDRHEVVENLAALIDRSNVVAFPE
jgi:hypothetical protein